MTVCISVTHSFTIDLNWSCKPDTVSTSSLKSLIIACTVCGIFARDVDRNRRTINVEIKQAANNIKVYMNNTYS